MKILLFQFKLLVFSFLIFLGGCGSSSDTESNNDDNVIDEQFDDEKEDINPVITPDPISTPDPDTTPSPDPDPIPETVAVAKVTSIFVPKSADIQAGQVVSISFECATCDLSQTKVEWFLDNETNPVANSDEFIPNASNVDKEFKVVVTPINSLGEAGDVEFIRFKKNKFVDIFSNQKAFAGLTRDGHVYTWGQADCGGESYSLDLTNVTQVYAFDCSFVAVKTDGTIITWGQHGVVYPTPTQNVIDVVMMSNDIITPPMYVALTSDGKLAQWGGFTSQYFPNTVENVVKIKSNNETVGALTADGKLHVIAKLYTQLPDDAVKAKLTNIKDFQITLGSYAALTNDGEVIGWGNTGGSYQAIESVEASFDNVKALYANPYSIVALNADNSIVTWGSYGSRDLSTLDFSNVKSVHTGQYSIGALKYDGTAVIWQTGSSLFPNTISHAYYSDVKSIIGDFQLGVQYNDNEFEPFNSGDFSDLDLSGTSTFVSNQYSHVALTNNNTIVWGNQGMGGLTGYADTKNLTKVVASDTAFSAINADGSIVSWGFKTASKHEQDITLKNAQYIVTAGSTYAALNDEGGVQTWGTPLNGGYIPEDIRASISSGVTSVRSTGCSILAIKDDQSVVTWGGLSNSIDGIDVPDSLCGLGADELNLSNVKDATGSAQAYALLKNDGTVSLAGAYLTADDKIAVAALTGVKKVIAMDFGFAFLTDQATATSIYSGRTPITVENVADIILNQDKNIVLILKNDGTLTPHGKNRDSYFNSVKDDLIDIKKILTSAIGLTGIKENGDAVYWHFSSTTTSAITVGDLFNAPHISGGGNIFIAKLSNDEIHTWGVAGSSSPIMPEGEIVSFYGNDRGMLYYLPNDEVAFADQIYMSRVNNVEKVLPVGTHYLSEGGGFYVLQKDGNIVAMRSAIALLDYPKTLLLDSSL